MLAGRLPDRKVRTGTGRRFQSLSVAHLGFRGTFQVSAGERKRPCGHITVRIGTDRETWFGPDPGSRRCQSRGGYSEEARLYRGGFAAYRLRLEDRSRQLPPAPSGERTPSEVTVKRVTSIMGLFVPMTFMIDGDETYGLWTDESYTFMLERGTTSSVLPGLQ